ncbi:hypothetical protein DSO57_1028745 [Entomophthora muscae]|uniref:Uncharacterized protein n=1 Tax=Entomophthora muscae TaxID=34485 RepID=A0ACC2RSG3_9FUNG|nr:hypothetical protein DSO57_1028745 [Entomophthora muscae]
MKLMFLVSGSLALEAVSSRIYNSESGITVLNSYIEILGDLAAKGRLHTNSKMLEKPHRDIHVSDKRLQDMLPHALFSVCSQAQVKSGVCVCKNFKKVKIIRSTKMDAQAAIAVDNVNRLVVVSYRPTVTEKNWRTSTDMKLVRYPTLGEKIRVHNGYLRHLISTHAGTETAVLRLLKQPKYRRHTLHVTGFSIGGSIAAISAPMWHSILKAHHLKNKIKVFVYSNPRPGNIAFSNHLNSLNITIIRYSKGGDVVPHLPRRRLATLKWGRSSFTTKNFQSLPAPLCLTRTRNAASNTTSSMPDLISFLSPLPCPHLPSVSISSSIHNTKMS